MKNDTISGKVTKHYFHYVNKDKFFWFFCISFLTFLFFLLIPPILGSAFRDLKVGDKIKSFTLKDTDGNDVNIEDYKGKFLILNFFQIDKEKSQKALQELSKLHKEYQQKDVMFVAVTTDKEKLDDIKKFKTDNGIGFPILIDEDKKVYQTFGIFVMPVTALVDKDAKIVYEYSSYLMGFDNEVGGRIKVALGEITLDDYKKSTEGTVIEKRTDEEKSALKKLGQAEVLLIRGRPDEALEILKEVIELDDNIAKAHLLFADALLKKGNLDESAEEYEKVKKMVGKADPVAKAASVGIGAILALKGNLGEAKKILSMSAMINPNPVTSAKAYYWLGFVAEKENDLKSAVTNYKKAVEKLLSKADRGR